MEVTVCEIAELVRGEVVGDGDVVIRGVAPFDDAGPDHITFAVTPEYKKRLAETNAGAVIVSADISEPNKVLVRVENPSLALAEVSARFHEVERPVIGVSREFIEISQRFYQPRILLCARAGQTRSSIYAQSHYRQNN